MEVLKLLLINIFYFFWNIITFSTKKQPETLEKRTFIPKKPKFRKSKQTENENLNKEFEKDDTE